LFDALPAQLQQVIHLLARERGTLGGALYFDEMTIAGADDVHVNLGARVLVIFQIKQRRSVNNADAHGRHLADNRRLRDPSLFHEALARNRGNYQEHAFVIAGPGERTYISELKAIGLQLGLDKQLIWAGPLYGEIKWAAIREAEAYILPSHQENFGISVVEALACSVPVLITNKVNIWREIVVDGGGLAETDDVSGICRLLERWSGVEPEQRVSMRDRARQCFLSRFDIAQTSSNLFSALERPHAI